MSAQPDPTEDLVLVMVAPDITTRVVGVAMDPVKLLTGKSVSEHLAGVLAGPPQPVNNQDTGDRELAYTVRIAPGKGFVIPLGPLGELGIAHVRDGVLSLTCPLTLVDTFNALLQDDLIRTSEPNQVEHNGQVMQQFFARTRPGVEFGFQLPKLGSIRVGRPV